MKNILFGFFCVLALYSRPYIVAYYAIYVGLDDSFIKRLSVQCLGDLPVPALFKVLSRKQVLQLEINA